MRFHPSTPDTVDFPVLGIPPTIWSGTRKLSMRGAAASRTPNGGIGPMVIATVTYNYYLPGETLSRLVIGQGPAEPHEFDNHSEVSVLLRSKERPSLDAPIRDADEAVTVEGVTVTATRQVWQDPRVSSVRFVWRGDRRVHIASWDYPLDAAFFRSLAEVEA